MKIETHPFDSFIPENIRYLFLGSFTSKDAKKGVDYDWYYSNGRNQFWPLIEKVYGLPLKSKKDKVALFNDLGIGIADIIYKCSRKENSSLDNKLEIIEFNQALRGIFDNELESVFFSSRFVEKLFHKNFDFLVNQFTNTKFTYLPSPSPRYAAMSKDEKVKIYKANLPSL